MGEHMMNIIILYVLTMAMLAGIFIVWGKRDFCEDSGGVWVSPHCEAAASK